MSNQQVKSYSAEFKERAVKLAVDADQSIAQTARDLGVNENTLHTWLSKYHEGGNGTQGRLHAEHLYDELKRLKKENALLKEDMPGISSWRVLKPRPIVTPASSASVATASRFEQYNEPSPGMTISL
jgi:transposase